MRYARVLTVLVVVVAGGLAALALARSGRPSPAAQVREAVLQEAQQLPKLLIPRGGFPLVGRQFAPSPVPMTCFVDGSSCSITPCVVPVASASPAVITVSPGPATRCPLGDRVPKTFRVGVR